MENIKINEPIPKLVKLSHEYSNVNSSIMTTLLPNNSQEKDDFEKLLERFFCISVRVSDIKQALGNTLTTGKLIKLLIDENKLPNISNNLELAETLDVSPTTVGRWINGERGITKENLNKLASLGNYSVEYLTGVNALPSHEWEKISNSRKVATIGEIYKHGISNLEKEILKECGYYLIDPYLNSKYYKVKTYTVELHENQRVNEKEWIPWVTTVKLFNEFPQKIALIKLTDLEEMNIDYWNINEPIEYSAEIEKKAQYVDFEKLKCIIEDRKSMLAFNFERSLESIK